MPARVTGANMNKKSILSWLFISILMCAGGVALGQEELSATDNFLTETVLHLAEWVFYGLGGTMVLFGVMVPIAEKMLKKNHDHISVWPRVGWAMLFFAIPAMMKYSIEWFNTRAEASGQLDGMNHLFQDEEE